MWKKFVFIEFVVMAKAIYHHFPSFFFSINKKYLKGENSYRNNRIGLGENPKPKYLFNQQFTNSSATYIHALFGFYHIQIVKPKVILIIFSHLGARVFFAANFRLTRASSCFRHSFRACFYSRHRRGSN
jgi:hypothetical protein